jgi:hypothetical protein
VSGVCSVKPNPRALLVEDVFRRFIEARVEFHLALERCALKGWPDRRAAIRSSTHLQQLFYERLSLRLKHLVLRGASDDVRWNEYTSTEKVHVRIQDGWSEDEERALRLSDQAYAQLESEILQVEATTDPPALDGPFTIVKRDPELLSAWSELNNTVSPLIANWLSNLPLPHEEHGIGVDLHGSRDRPCGTGIPLTGDALAHECVPSRGAQRVPREFAGED